MIAEHAPLAPSSAPQWGNCSGSVAVQAGVPDFDTQQTREGTAAHWVGATCLAAFQGIGPPMLTCGAYLGMTAPNGVVIDKKMTEGAQVYVDDVLTITQRHGGLKAMLIEHRVHMPQIHTHNWGTLDTALPLLDKYVIYLWDYKHGHRDNRAEKNLQLIDYIAGMVAELKIDGYDDQKITIVMRIVQPFCYHADGPVNEWVVKLGDLRSYFNKLEYQAKAVYTNPTLTTGIWCRDCKGLSRCPAARKAAYSLIDYVDQPLAIDAMTGADLATERGILADGVTVARARLEAIEDDLLYRVTNGEADTGLAVETSEGRLAWKIPVPDAVALADQFGVDISIADVLTPTQAIAAMPANLRPLYQDTIKTVTGRPAGKLKLVDVGSTTAARAFKKEGV